MSSSQPYLKQARLPQRGFASDIDFESLSKDNKFLFRVYTPKERSPFADDTDPFLVAPRFDELYQRSPIDIPTIIDASVQWSYAEVAKHMEWTTRSSSSYISTSFSFSWAIWEAVRRYHVGVKKDIQIAIIDTEVMISRAATAVQLLNTCPPPARDEQFWKWHRFSEDSQSVLVYGMIPRTAVLGSVPLLQILRKMPSYFLRKDVQIIEGNPLSQVSWDYTQKKHTYRQFCHSMQKAFTSRPMETRLRDSTAGAVRLALSFLRPLFHNLVLEDFDRALSYLRTLSITISEWPGSDWIQDHPEIRQIVESMVLALGEELREKYSRQKSDEISRLQVVIDGLEETLRTEAKRGRRLGTRTRFIIDDIQFDSDGDFELELFEESEDPTLVSMSAHQDVQSERKPEQLEHDRPSLAVSVSVVPHIPIAFQTPITPPDSPSVPTLFSKPAGTPTAQISFQPPLNVAESEIPLHPFQVFSPSTARSPGELAPLSARPTSPLSRVFIFPSETRLGDDEDKPTVEIAPATVLHLGNDNDIEKKPVVVQTAVQQETLIDKAAKETKPEDGFSTENGTFMSTDEPIPCPHDEEQHDGPDDDDRTRAGDSDQEELGDRYTFQSSPPSISSSWVAVRHRRLSSADRPVLSPRSSITSIATLWEPTEFPLKRMSGYSESHDTVPTMRSLGVTSRTVSFSFSDFSPPRSQPLALIEDVDPLKVALPPSPSPSEAEIPLPPSISQSSSSHFTATTSTSSDTPLSSVDSRTWLPLVTPLPPSPAPSMGSLPSSVSRSSSSSSTSMLSEWQIVSARSISPEPTPIDEDDERKPYSIIPPKEAIRLLSPVSASQPQHKDDDDADTLTSTHTRTHVRHPSRTSHVGETASYIVTGFLVGAFLTLFLFSTQRRTIIHLT